MKTNATPLTPRKLVTALLFRFASFYAFLGLILFLPAGTLRYWEAWVSIIMLTVPVLFLVVYLYKRDPGLLERRMRTKETQRTQKVVIILSSLSLFLVFIIPGFDHRFGWSSVPVPLTIISQLFILAGYWLFALVLKTNSYASRIIEVEKGQK
ncbi:MAG: isoprenylcysteine carboxylmethyltransferase family protein, partial [Dehalococcoidia bacterium]|nr:isoprenylcysteine carboxylmethyltransferase family protein [Dehalococcoidia bacterium]